jgi:hypothetical protein
MNTTLMNARWLILLGAASALIIAVVIGVLVHDQPKEEPVRVSLEEPPEMITAATALKTATRDAQEWQDDAQLTSAVVHCRNVGRQPRPVNWAFQFYSPSTGRLALIVVTQGDAVRVRDALSPYKVPAIPRRRWRIASDEAVRIWWENGGRYLVTRRPDAALTLRLDVPEDEAQDPVWTVVGSIPDQGSEHMVRLSGFDGRVLEE